MAIFLQCAKLIVRYLSMACRQAGITEQTYYRWRKEYGGLKLDQAKKLVADLSLDNAILREVSSGKF